MSHQGEDDWYPECNECGCGNLGSVVCSECHEATKNKSLVLFALNIGMILNNNDLTSDEKIQAIIKYGKYSG